MISKYRPNASLTLVRNPDFRQWSYAAQPGGYPSVIRFEQVASAAQQQSAVIAGRADLVNTYLNGQANDELAARYPTRTYAGLKVFTDYLFLNTRHPPFSNIKARRAVNYAIDRVRMLQLLHRATGQAVVTCQILPADFPGHQAYCPYTAGTKDGTWHSPDIEKARRLVQESHTANTPVTVWTIQGLTPRGVGSYLARMLNDLGYRARWQSMPLGRYDPFRNNVQMGLF